MKTVKSVATAVTTSRMAPKMIPLLLKANGSERTPPPVCDVVKQHATEKRGYSASLRYRVIVCCVRGEVRSASKMLESY